MAKRFNPGQLKGVKVAKKAGKVTMSGVKAAIAAELTVFGSALLISDAEVAGKMVKYAVDPDVYSVKKGCFGKKETVKINPVTGKMTAVKSDKAPVNKKTIKVK